VTIEVSFHPEAVRELRAAFLWYFDRNPVVAQSFQAETEHAIEVVLENPRRWPKWGKSERQYVFPRFPFNLIYRVNLGVVEVIAVAHQKRKPGYWKKR
jgi:plasmid stabilization system protein ParE